ncbi:LLM class flavin-dependent oxidoreductase [Amnibacterium endophyticum]|uniref:LLM class flavin-dependent oxidoreductase n=1 Tax=Amnibacterium endophyticum TaxID=2109337 RepID=A0ABW4LGL8_9MICO
MSRPQHFGWFFSRGFGPQGWARPYWEWDWAWTEPQLYQQSARELEQAGFELLIIEDALSLGNPETLDLRTRKAYGGPKHDPLMLVPYLFDVTRHLGITPTINAGATPPYLAARQAATLQGLSRGRFGLNVVTDTGSARHFGAEQIGHDAAYDRADEWTHLLHDLWHGWDDDVLVEDAATGHYARGDRLRTLQHEGEWFRVTGPLNAVPTRWGDPVIVSPGGSPPGLAFAGTHSDVQLALAPLDVASVRDYRAKVLGAPGVTRRAPGDIRILFVIKPELVSSPEEADRVVAASQHPDDAALREVAEAWSSDLETDLTTQDLDRPLDRRIFAEHVSAGTIRGLYGKAADAEEVPLRELLARKARKGRILDRTGLVGTADEFADLIEEFGDDADNDGFILSGDLHPVTLHRMLDDLVPILRRRGILRRGFGDGGLRDHLLEF